MRHLDAFESRGDDRGASAWTVVNQVLDSQEVQGQDGAEAKINPARVPIEQKESIRWLEKSTAIDRPSRFPWTMCSHW